MALTPEQYQQLRAHYAQSGSGAYYDPATGYQVLTAPAAGQQSGSIQNGEWVSNPNNEARVTQGVAPNGGDRTWLNGRDWQQYNNSGSPTSNGTWQGLTPDGWKDDLTQIGKGALVMGAAAFGGGLLQGAGGAAGGAGAGLSESGLAGVGAEGATNALGGAGAFGPAGSAYYGSAAGLGAGGAGMGAGGSGAFLGEGMASGVPAWDAAASNAGLSLTAPAGSVSAAGLLNPGTVQTAAEAAAAAKKNPWLAAATTVAGGLLGSQGENKTATETKNMLPEMKPYVFGAPGQMGLLQDAQALKDQQMTPQAQAKWQTMMNVGQGLLSQPMAGNGYEKFAGRTLR